MHYREKAYPWSWCITGSPSLAHANALHIKGITHGPNASWCDDASMKSPGISIIGQRLLCITRKRHTLGPDASLDLPRWCIKENSWVGRVGLEVMHYLHQNPVPGMFWIENIYRLYIIVRPQLRSTQAYHCRLLAYPAYQRVAETIDGREWCRNIHGNGQTKWTTLNDDLVRRATGRQIKT